MEGNQDLDLFFQSAKRMDGLLAILRLFNIISVISERWEGDKNVKLCAIEPRCLLGKISASSGSRNWAC